MTGPDRTASTPTETPASPARTPSTPGSVDAPTATDTPVPTATTAPPAASGSAETDREALVALYNATDGENWTFSDSWLSDARLGEWEYVTTNDDGRVTELDLNFNGLSGEIPAELGSLSNLRGLYLHDNSLGGEIPAELGSLSNLTELDLSGSHLSGCVPSSSQPKSVLEKLPRVQVLEPLPAATEFLGPQLFGERLAGGQVFSGPTAGGLGEIRRREVGLSSGGTLQVLGKLALDPDDGASAVGYGYIKMWRSACKPSVELRFEVQ